MNQSDLKSGNNAVSKTPGDWNVETIIEQIFSDLNGVVTRSTIQKVLTEVVPRYEKARIQTFVPIFIRRDAFNQLQSMQVPFAAPEMEINEAEGRNESQVNSDPSLYRIARDEQDKAIDTGLVHLKPAARGNLVEKTLRGESSWLQRKQRNK